MSARIFLHPRLTAGPALGAFDAMMTANGYDTEKLKVFTHPGTRTRFELVRILGSDPVEHSVTYQRMDDHRFTKREFAIGPQECA